MKLGILIPSVTTHKGAILAKLLHGEKLRNKRLFHDIDSCASGSRISELRSDGWKNLQDFLELAERKYKKAS